MSKNQKIKVGISIGDLNGIGIEVILKTFKDSRMIDFFIPIIFGSHKVISEHKKALNIEAVNFNIINKINDASPKKLNLLNIWKKDIHIQLGNPSLISAEYAFDSLKSACKELKNGTIDVLVTAPINKATIQQKIKNFVGHTEFLENEFKGDSLMIMVSEYMKISFVTGHIPLSEVANIINIETIIKKATQFNNSLIKDFGIIKPKIAVLGLNPHAGEQGMLGRQEHNIIEPAIIQLKEKGILAFGPYAADSFFTQRNIKGFDGILSMYHDQGLIPFKTLSFSEGVNYTAGLKIVRTSPVHGTAYEISGKNKADEQSFRESVFLACDIFKKRAQFQKLTEK